VASEVFAREWGINFSSGSRWESWWNKCLLNKFSSPFFSVFPYQSLIHHCSTLTHHRAISLRTRHIDISSVSRSLHLGVVFGSVETQLYFSSREKSTSFWTQQRVFFLNGISASSSFPAQRSDVKKDPKILQRGGPHTYRILKFVEGFNIRIYRASWYYQNFLFTKWCTSELS
jgi:hypothetical protein